MKRINVFYCILINYCIIILPFLQCGENKNDSRLNNNTVIVGCVGDERIFFYEYSGDGASDLMFLPLVALERVEYGEPQPVLAERWEHTEDYRNWTFYLRKDIKWHDGIPVTAHDVKFSLDLIDRDRNAIKGIEPFRNVNIKDDYIVTVTYKKPTDGLNTQDICYPKHLLENLDPAKMYEWEFWKQPVGNGPYKYVRHVPKTMVEIEANPDYYRGKPKIEKVILKFIQDQSYVELLSGNLDTQSYTNRDIVLKLSGDDRFRFYHWWGSQIGAIYWNHRNSLFSSASIRRALTMAINRKELGELLNYPEGVPIIDAITTRRQFQQKLYPEPYPYDPDKAMQILEEAGWRDSDGNGILDNNGKEFRFSAIVRSNGDNIRTAVYVQDQLRKIGIKIDLQVHEYSIISQRASKGDYEAIFQAIVNTTLHPLGGHIIFFGKDSPLGYENAEMVRLLNLAGDTVDPDEKDRIYRSIIPIFYEDLPVTLLLPNVFTHIVNKRIKGLISPYRAEPVCNMEYLWIEEENK
jgi:peptide/nickel transport system substrate-binding protein